MIKMISLILTAALCVGCLSGCGENSNSDGKISHSSSEAGAKKTTDLMTSASTNKPSVAVIGTADFGDKGENVKVTLYSDGLVKISGKGKMRNCINEQAYFDKENGPLLIALNEISKESSPPVNEIVIENGVESIGAYAFWYLESLKKITISSSVTSIEYGAFEYCNSLTEIILPNGVKTIYDGAFYDCESLKTITIPGSVNEIGKKSDYGYYVDAPLGYYYMNAERTKVPGFTIKGKSGSEAHKYAKKHGFNFVEN